MNSRHVNEARAAMYARAEFYVWVARKESPMPGNDPITGQPITIHRELDRAVSRAGHAAMARECYRRARLYPNPLP